MRTKFLQILLVFLFTAFGQMAVAQDWSSPEIEQLYQQAKTTLSRGNASEAVAILQKVKAVEPTNVLVQKLLAQSYELSGYHKMALQELEPMFANGQADAENYRVAAQAYMGMQEEKKAQKILSEGISKYSKSGLLYYEQGLMYKKQKNYESALKSWLDGIANDPNFHLNYHEAAIAYVQTDKVIWAIIYGEIFVNKEPNTQRSFETRILLLDAYQKLFFTPSKEVNVNVKATPANFEDAVQKTFMSLFFVVSDGINTENLTMLRSRFVVSWMNNYATQFPFSLFEYHNQMMRNGYFDAYNQWLFGKAENPQQYTTWTSTFSDEMTSFEQFRLKTPLQINGLEQYNTNRNFKGLFTIHDNKSPKR